MFMWHEMTVLALCLSLPPDIRHPEELSLLRKPRDPKKKKKKLEEAEEDDLELEGPLLTPGSGELMDGISYVEALLTLCSKESVNGKREGIHVFLEIKKEVYAHVKMACWKRSGSCKLQFKGSRSTLK